MGKNLKKQKQFRFSDSELALLERLKARHGSYTNAVVRGLKALDEAGNNQPSDEDILSMLAERLGTK